MPARKRCLCQSRLVIWLTGVVLQLKRGGLALRRLFRRPWAKRHPSVSPVAHLSRVQEPSARCFAGWQDHWNHDQAASSTASRWQRLNAWWSGSRWAVRRSARGCNLSLRRAGLRAKRVLRKRSAWTFATVTGSLGLVLMIVLQLAYSFQPVQGKESLTDKTAPESYPKTRIDPGLPQGRQHGPIAVEIAQADPFAPQSPFEPFEPIPQAPQPLAEPESNLEPLPVAEPPRLEPVTDPLAVPFQPKPDPEPFIDPLDNLPPFDPPAMEREPAEPEFNLEPLPVVEPPRLEPVTEPAVVPLQPKPDPEPFIDPLDNLPPFDLGPRESQPPAPPVERTREVDPLDALSPFDPPAMEREPIPPAPPEAPPVSVEMNVDVVRLPQDDRELFLRQSAASVSPERLPRELLLDPWDQFSQPERQDPLPPHAYWDRLSREEQSRLAQDLVSPAPTDYDAPGQFGGKGGLAVSIEKVIPRRTTAQVPLNYEIIVENRGSEMIESTYVDEVVPPTHRLADVSPAGHFENNLLRWRLSRLKPGEQRRLSVEVVPSQTGTIETTTSVRPTALVGSSTQVDAVRLKLSVTIPERVRVGEPCPMVFRVTNPGPGDVENVVVRDWLPAGLTHEIGREMEYVIDKLPAGESRETRLVPMAKVAGEIENRAEVTLGEVVQDVVTTRTRIYSPPVRIRRRGLKEVPLEQAVHFTNLVWNLTEERQENLKIVETVPLGFRVVKVEDGGLFDQRAGTITWTLAELPAGASRELGVRLEAMQTGELLTRVTGSTESGEAVPIRASVFASEDQRLNAPVSNPPSSQAAPGRCPCCCTPCRCERLGERSASSALKHQH